MSHTRKRRRGWIPEVDTRQLHAESEEWFDDLVRAMRSNDVPRLHELARHPRFPEWTELVFSPAYVTDLQSSEALDALLTQGVPEGSEYAIRAAVLRGRNRLVGWMIRAGFHHDAPIFGRPPRSLTDWVAHEIEERRGWGEGAGGLDWVGLQREIQQALDERDADYVLKGGRRSRRRRSLRRRRGRKERTRGRRLSRR